MSCLRKNKSKTKTKKDEAEIDACVEQEFTQEDNHEDTEIAETSFNESTRLLINENESTSTLEKRSSSPDLVAEIEAYMASRLFHKYILSEKDFFEVSMNMDISRVIVWSIFESQFLEIVYEGGFQFHVRNVLFSTSSSLCWLKEAGGN